MTFFWWPFYGLASLFLVEPALIVAVGPDRRRAPKQKPPFFFTHKTMVNPLGPPRRGLMLLEDGSPSLLIAEAALLASRNACDRASTTNECRDSGVGRHEFSPRRQDNAPGTREGWCVRVVRRQHHYFALLVWPWPFFFAVEKNKTWYYVRLGIGVLLFLDFVMIKTTLME